MAQKSFLLALVILCTAIGSASAGGKRRAVAGSEPSFIQNVGQVRDQFGNPRSDIAFALQTPRLHFFIGDCQLHYQFIQSGGDDCGTGNISGSASVESGSAITFQSYRIDVRLLGANPHPAVKVEQQLPYYENYCIPGLSGLTARTFNRINYQNVYPNIDWNIFIRNGKVEHEFVIRPGGDPSLIKLQYNGQTSLTADICGNITATSPMGEVKEHAPVCYDADGKMIPVSVKICGDTLSYNFQAPSQWLVIDPVVEWSTYYGAGPDSLATTYFYDIVCDDSANLYAAGLTYSSTLIATTGTFQSAYQGNSDGFLVKFDSSGHRLWGTYYGGENGDWASAVTVDKAGYIFLGGSTASTTGISTPGTQQPVYVAGGLWEGFLAKFNKAGARVWGTYVGGTVGPTFDLEVSSVNCDTAGHVFVSGATDDTNNVATPGSFKPRKIVGVDTVQCFLIQYDTTGRRTWGTYYGGELLSARVDNFGGYSCTDGSSIYLAGNVNCNCGAQISTSGSYQPALRGGNTDAFIAKFDNLGNRAWGTFYGGEGDESLGGIAYGAGSVYLSGNTTSDSAIASAGSFQPVNAGGTDIFLASFEPSTGFRNWGTYYGGPGFDNTLGRVAADKAGNAYVMGYTNSTSGIASAGAWQASFAGGTYDALFTAYNAAGAQLWSTYLGGSLVDKGFACAFDGKNAYLCGQTNSPDNIATPGSFLDTGGGATYYFQGFLTKFYSPCVVGAIIGPAHICRADSVIVTDTSAGGQWSSSNTAVAIIGSVTGKIKGLSAGTFIVTYSLPSGCFATVTDTVLACISYVQSVTGAGAYVEVYPNPVTAVLTVNKHGSGYSTYKVFSEGGGLVMQGKLPDDISVINATKLPTGFYYIKLLNDSEVIVKSFIKK